MQNLSNILEEFVIFDYSVACAIGCNGEAVDAKNYYFVATVFEH